MPRYTSALHDEALHKASYLKKFIESYGEGANLQALYKAQPVWIRFAPLFPRTAYLIDIQYWIFSAIDVALLDFRTALIAHDTTHNWDKVGAPYDVSIDPFAFFLDSKTEEAERSCLLHLRWALRRSRGTRLEHLFRECAHDLLIAAKTDERKQIRQELLDKEGEVAEALTSASADLDTGVWNARRRILIREEVVDDALNRIRESLEESPSPLKPSEITEIPFPREPNGYEYGEGSVPVTDQHRRSARFADQPYSPPRSRSPMYRSGRARYEDDRLRSSSRDSRRSSIGVGSSVTTWLPQIPEDPYSLSVGVLSTTSNSYKDCLAVMDTGCDAGNFISSSFLDQLEMEHAIEADAELAAMTLLDFGGKSDFRPVGRVKLKWYGREIDLGNKGKRTMHFTGDFFVAPRIVDDRHGEPFQMLLGKEWIVSCLCR